MNTYNFNDESFKTTEVYKNFISTNPSVGYLKIRAYAANQAIPISDVKIIISKKVGINNIIFFEGKTNESGIIEKISLPAPKLDMNDLTVPKNITYEVIAIYEKNNVRDTYVVGIYENIYVVQTINIVPTLNAWTGDE